MRWPALILSLAAAPALAQDVQPCDWQTGARNIPEPWQAHTRTFSNGQTRLAVLDTVEPAAGAMWLMILSPPRDVLGSRQCRVVGIDGMGFPLIDFAALDAAYDPARGLIFSVPVTRYDPASARFDPYSLRLVLNQATGAIDTTLIRE